MATSPKTTPSSFPRIEHASATATSTHVEIVSRDLARGPLERRTTATAISPARADSIEVRPEIHATESARAG